MVDRRKLLKIVIPDANKMIDTPSCIVATQTAKDFSKDKDLLEYDNEMKYDHYKLALKVKAYNRAIGIYNEADLICSTESPISITSYMTSFPKIQSYNHFSPKKTASNRFPCVSADEIPDSELFTIPHSPNSFKKQPKHDRYTSLYKLKNKLLSRRERKMQELRSSAFTTQRVETSSPVSFPPLTSSILQISHITPATGRSNQSKFTLTGKLGRLKRRSE